MTEPTLTQALESAGFTHRRPAGAEPGTPGAAAHEIIDSEGNVVATLKAHQAWEWLATRRQSETKEGATDK